LIVNDYLILVYITN